jgi:hypothetical protein
MVPPGMYLGICDNDSLGHPITASPSRPRVRANVCMWQVSKTWDRLDTSTTGNKAREHAPFQVRFTWIGAQPDVLASAESFPVRPDGLLLSFLDGRQKQIQSEPRYNVAVELHEAAVANAGKVAWLFERRLAAARTGLVCLVRSSPFPRLAAAPTPPTLALPILILMLMRWQAKNLIFLDPLTLSLPSALF